MYEDAADPAPPPTPKPESSGAGQGEEGEQTGLLPKSFFGSKDLTPGNQCKVEIIKSYDDEVAVRYVSHSDSSDEEKTEPVAATENDSDYE